MQKPGRGGLVYSTDGGRMCPDCRRPVADCGCAATSRGVRSGAVRVFRDAKGRAGKVVTVVRGIDLDAAALVLLGKRLRTACGSGGTVKDGVLELQGDHCDRVVEYLKQEGYAAKRAGG